jgi:hypothetical protein
MTSRTEIIKAQESIGNVEISKNSFGNLERNGEFAIWLKEDIIYFAPRDVVYPDEKIGCGEEFYGGCPNLKICGKNNYLCPSCQKKKDNHTRQQDVRKNDLGETNPHLSLSAEHIPAEDIPSSKTFEDVKKIMGELDTDLVCIDFNRDLSKKDYQIITAFFNKINKARIKLGLKKIIHTNY